MPSLSLTLMDTLGFQSLGEHFFLFEPVQVLLGGLGCGICSGTECKPAIPLKEEFNHALRLHCSLPSHSTPSIT